MNSIKNIQQLEVANKRVLLRVDFNVPLNAEGVVTDDTRIVAALPTIRYLIEQKCRIILMSHLGRPTEAREERYSLKPVASDLSQKLGQPVIFADDSIGPSVEDAVEHLEEGSVLLLENVRFNPGETKNDPDLSASFAKFADVYINDAFGSAHRAHASTAGVAKLLPVKGTGFLMDKELQFLGEKTAQPERPFLVILGGAKVSDKIGVIDALLDKADSIIIGGAMAYTFKLALGQKTGDSLTEPDKLHLAQAAMDKAKKRGVSFFVPVDNRATDQLDFDKGQVGDMRTFEGDIDEGWEGVDIGPKTMQIFSEQIAKAKTILWNGPMGVFEIEACNKGTFAIAKAVAENKSATSIIGGGDSVSAIHKSGFKDAVSFISTGGGASLELLEGKDLPGVMALAE